MYVTASHAVLLLCFLSVFTLGESDCGAGWFGSSCKYQCHCSKQSCDASGGCIAGSRCNSEWFGPACQYQDLFSFDSTSTTPEHALSILGDRNDTTCLSGNVENITIVLNSSYPISWMRLTVNKNDFKRNITIMINDGQGSTHTCNNAYLIDDRTMDFFCDVQISTQQLTLKGRDVGYLCSLSISGGRNVALRQSAMQSSDYDSNNVANKAVDGDRNTLFNKNTCTHTKTTDKSPSWNVTFSTFQLVNRYVLFNRAEVQNRLRTASIFSYNTGNKSVFNDTLPNQARIVYVLTSQQQNVSFVRISANDPEKILTLCEVEIYGDSVCPTNYFGLECNKSCNCENKAETCYVSTGGCPSGCAAGFYGDGCQKACSQGRWGVDCTNQCVHCINKTCDRHNGACEVGCEDGYIGETCDHECSRFTWGKDCSHECSPQCLNKSCNITSGVCLSGCTDGYMGDSCTKACPSATWGKGCQYNCSDHCLDHPCNVTNGRCDSGCQPGYLGHNCTVKCPKLTWASQCLKRCSDHCLNKTCDFVNGSCDHGCDGDYNNTQCLDVIENVDDASPPLAAFVAPIAVGIVLILVTIVGVISWRRRRDGNKKFSKEQVSKERLCIKQNKLITDEDKNTSIKKEYPSSNERLHGNWAKL